MKPSALDLAVSVILSAAFDRSGLTQDQLAPRIGVKQTTVSLLLRGMRAFTLTEFELACTALDLDWVEVYRRAKDNVPTVAAEAVSGAPSRRQRRTSGQATKR